MWFVNLFVAFVWLDSFSSELFGPLSNMRSNRSTNELQKRNASWKFPSMRQCLCYGGEASVKKKLPLPEPLGEVQQRLDAGDIEEAEASLRGNGALNYEVGMPFAFL